MRSLIQITQILKAGVAKNPVSELMNGVFFFFFFFRTIAHVHIIIYTHNILFPLCYFGGSQGNK